MARPPDAPAARKPARAADSDDKIAAANSPAAGAQSPNASPARESAPADPSNPAPVANDSAPDPSAKTIAAPVEHSLKSDPAPAAPNLPQPSAAPPPTQAPPTNHITLDATAAATPNTQAAPPSSTQAPVKFSFTPAGSVDAPSFDALALKVAAHSADGSSNFSIRLDPPELGRIEVNLNVNSDGHAEAQLSADKPQTLELLQKDAPQLERALRDVGLNLAGGLAFSLKGDGRSQAWRDGQGNGRGRALQIGTVDSANANVALATSAALAAQAYGLPTARLDIRI